MPSSERGPWWCFTLNNPGDYRVPFDEEKVQFLQYQLEKAPTTGTLHYQGVIQFRDGTTTRKRCLQFFDPKKPHVEAMRAPDPKQAISYCQKKDTYVDGPWSHGDPVSRGSHKRKRAQVEEEYDADPRSFKLVRPDDAIQIEVDRMSRDFEENAEAYSLDRMDRPWQRKLLEELKAPPNDRTIHWVYGPAGAEGKSTFAKALARSGWAYVSSRNLADMTYQYARQGLEKHVVVDVERRVSGYDAIYAFIEMVKNRVISSTKYRSFVGFSRFPVHVVVMSNMRYEKSKISNDRMCEHDLSEQKEEYDFVDFDYVKVK